MKLKTPRIDQEQGFSNGLSIRLTWRVCEEISLSLKPRVSNSGNLGGWEFVFPTRFQMLLLLQDPSEDVGPEILALLDPCVQ